MTKNYYREGFAKVASDNGLDPAALIKVAMNLFGNQLGSLKDNWNGIKDWWNGQKPGTSAGIQHDVETNYVQDSNQGDHIFKSSIVRPSNLIDNLHGRYNEYMRNRALNSGSGKTQQERMAIRNRYPNPYHASVITDDSDTWQYGDQNGLDEINRQRAAFMQRYAPNSGTEQSIQ